MVSFAANALPAKFLNSRHFFSPIPRWGLFDIHFFLDSQFFAYAALAVIGKCFFSSANFRALNLDSWVAGTMLVMPSFNTVSGKPPMDVDGLVDERQNP